MTIEDLLASDNDSIFQMGVDYSNECLKLSNELKETFPELSEVFTNVSAMIMVLSIKVAEKDAPNS